MRLPRAIRPDNHPFPFLLYVEWALLAIAAISEFLPKLLPKLHSFPGIAIASLLGFAALGLWLPTRSLKLRLIHVISQFGLILSSSQLGLSGLRLFPFLYVVLVIRSCLLFKLRGRLIIVGTAFAMFLVIVRVRLRVLDRQLPAAIEEQFSPYLAIVRLNLILLFAILLLFVLLFVNALLSERERREQLRQANDKLQRSAARIEKLAMAQERSRIARELHDALGHSLTALNIQLEGALKLWEGNPDRAKIFLSQAKQMGSRALQDVRQAVATLRDTPHPGENLESAIATLTQQLQQTTAIAPEVSLNFPTLPPAIAIASYRILQEALTNVCKYANATAVTLEVKAIARSSNSDRRFWLHIAVTDNGCGFSPQDNTTGFGLKSMQERAEAEDGTFRLSSAPGEGCKVEVWLPLSEETL
ncbi:sensor histidine kinase [Baaleninema simplex]|uniref:sensor histidine kinase n=1 Tax=Baaleninema simplex TaxID=2862350 RepID=UPI00034C9EA0|nr:sensor histidine kinase [Baaleninema simplex]